MTRAPWPTSTWKPAGRLHVEAEHAVVVVTAEPVRDRQARCPRPVEGGADVVALAGLDHDVVQHLGQLERRPGQGDGVVALVAVVEAHLAARCPPRSPSRASRTGRCPSPSVRKRCDSSKRGRGEHDVAEADALGEEATGHERRRERRVGVLAARSTISTGTPHGAVTRASRSTRRIRQRRRRCPRRPRSRPRGPGRRRASNASPSTASKPTNTASFAGPASTMMRWALSSLRQVTAPLVVRFARDQADHVAEERRRGSRVGDLDAEVGELDLVLHVHPL